MKATYTLLICYNPTMAMKCRVSFTVDELRAIFRAGGIVPTSHLWQKTTGVRRPGKTARDKENGHIPYRKNRRVWDDKEGAYVKV